MVAAKLTIATPNSAPWNTQSPSTTPRGSVSSTHSLRLPHTMGPKLRIATPQTSKRPAVSGPQTTPAQAWHQPGTEVHGHAQEKDAGFWKRLGRQFLPLPEEE